MIAVAAAESCILDGREAMVVLQDKMRADTLIFDGSQSKITVGVPESKTEDFEKLSSSLSAKVSKIGKVSGSKMVIKSKEKEIVNIDIKELKEKYFSSIGDKIKN